MVQTWGGSSSNNETFTGTITKVNANTIVFKDKRASKPVYSIDGSNLTVTGDTFNYGSISGVKYGADSIVVSYTYGVGSSLYDVKWVCK